MKITKKNERDMIRELDAYFEEVRRGLEEESSKIPQKSSSNTNKTNTKKIVSN
ncbi:MAG: hypothetical protein JSV71_01020 [Nitrospiraceae bacterium]|nr:MAG: hypothetical protein JSV71_01020 [Nitrospiraceae bacterium]